MSCSFFDLPESKAKYTQIDCKIYEGFTLIAQYPGFYCSFASNGEWLSLDEDTLTFYDKNNSVKFKFPQLVHHELKFSRDESKIYFLSSEVKTYKNLKTRFDVINISDLKGNILYRWNTFDHIDEIFKKLELNEFKNEIPTDIPPSHNLALAPYEFSHLNAISEIPENDLEKKYSFMKKGNLLVTFNGLAAIVIFDPELKTMQHYFTKMINTELYGFHDAQILPNGHLIFFKNVSNKEGELVTSLDEMNLETGEVVWSFSFKKPNFERNPINGSVQVLENNNILIGENSHGGRAVEITRSGKIVGITENIPRDPVTGLPIMVYRAKKVDVDKFLKTNQIGIWARNQH